jgi:hypothetical protein
MLGFSASNQPSRLLLIFVHGVYSQSGNHYNNYFSFLKPHLRIAVGPELLPSVEPKDISHLWDFVNFFT